MPLVLAFHHIGNSDDLSERCKEILRNADVLVFEDDRGARAALKAAGVHRPYEKYSEHREKGDAWIDALRAGKTVCYMSDQGSPSLADPGQDVLERALAFKQQITVIPGASSVTAALAACPFKQEQFYYRGFLSREEPKRQKELAELQSLRCPIVFLETPYRVVTVLKSIAQVFPRRIHVSFDITGPKERHFQLQKIPQDEEKLAELLYETIEDRGKLNAVIILEGK